jgi:ATP-dependent Clp protease protease subunit
VGHLLAGCLKDRIVFLGTEVDDDVANIIIAQLLYLESEDPGQGDHDLYQQPRRRDHLGPRDLRHHAVHPLPGEHAVPRHGGVDGVGAPLRGHQGPRLALPNSRILLHQPLGGVRGQATDIEIHAKEILYLRAALTEIYVKHTGQSRRAKIRRDTERDFYLQADDSKAIWPH